MFRMFKAKPYEKESASTAQVEDSTSKVTEVVLGKGGPPVAPPKFGKRVRIYDPNVEIKTDKDGLHYIGMNIDELMEDEQKKREEESFEQDANQDSQIVDWPCNIL